MTSKVYSIRVPEDLAMDIDKHCTEQGTNAAEMIRGLVQEHMHPDNPDTEQVQGKALVIEEQPKEDVQEAQSEYNSRDLNTEIEALKVRCGLLEDSMKQCTGIIDYLVQRVDELENNRQAVDTQESEYIAKPEDCMLGFLFDDGR